VKHLFANTDKLKEGLLKAWSTSVESKISTVPVPLSPQIAALINGTDFTIFGGLHVDEVLDAIRGTAFYITNFGGGFPQRPLATEPPPDISAHETRYTEKLFAVYGERLAKPVGNLADLTPNTFERRHFNQMRRQFYSAEALSEFVRELTEQGTFAHFQKDIFNAVVWPVFTDDYATSFQRLQKTLSCAAVIPQGSNAIYLVAEAIDKQGVCHQLANGDELDWDNP
jgi:hypothetical protein